MNCSFCYYLLKYEARIKDKELYDKEQKIHRNFFYIDVLKELLPKTFSEIFKKKEILKKIRQSKQR